MGDSGLKVQPQTDHASGKQVLHVSYKNGNATRVNNELNRIYPEAKFTLLSKDLVGPSVSGEIQKSAIVATVLALFGILIYVAFRYEYSFAIGAVIAILHDVLMTGGLFFLSGRELNAPIVAAILTIIGFSINDTIVIFDRIRENLRLGTRGTFADVMNAALNQTLSRTIITSGTTLLSTATLFFYGGTVINDFAFMFLVGIITGTYSSIYIACAVVLWWHEGKRPELAAPIQDVDPVTVSV
jgi:SecD/SecF fusion protein